MISAYNKEFKTSKKLIIPTIHKENIEIIFESYTNPQIRTGMIVNTPFDTSKCCGALVRQSRSSDLRVKQINNTSKMSKNVFKHRIFNKKIYETFTDYTAKKQNKEYIELSI